MRRTVGLQALSIALALTSRASGDTLLPGDAANTFELTAAVTGLTVPTSFDWLPDGRMVITDKNGAVLLATGGTTKVVGAFPVVEAAAGRPRRRIRAPSPRAPVTTAAVTAAWVAPRQGAERASGRSPPVRSWPAGDENGGEGRRAARSRAHSSGIASE